MRDWRGTLIFPGTYIVYPVRQSSLMWMVEARVEELAETEDPFGKVTPVLKVKPLNSTWTRSSTSNKIVTLTVLDRVTVINPPVVDSHVPDGYCAICHDFHFAEGCNGSDNENGSTTPGPERWADEIEASTD